MISRREEVRGYFERVRSEKVPEIQLDGEQEDQD
jgi:hypothetical protein